MHVVVQMTEFGELWRGNGAKNEPLIRQLVGWRRHNQSRLQESLTSSTQDESETGSSQSILRNIVATFSRYFVSLRPKEVESFRFKMAIRWLHTRTGSKEPGKVF